MYLRRADGEKIYIDETMPLGKGGEARVYPVSEFPNWAAKVYFDERATPERAAKLAVMRDHPPRVPIGSDDHVPIAWPVELLYDLKDRERVVGFLMPRAYDVVEIIDFYNPQHRLQHNPLFDYRYLIRAARNLAATVRALHARNYIVGDLKHANILATDTALITLVDTDSFQVVDPDTEQVYPCPVRTPEFTPPELQGMATGQEILLPEHDNFGLAVLIFHLLMEGTHPFAGVYDGDDDPPPFEERIAQGHFPYGPKPGPYRPGSRSAPPFSMLPPPIQALFLRCFDAGFADPTVRPTAQEWQAALDEAKRALTHCAENPSHYYSNHLIACPWCERKVKQLRGVDPFPSEAEVDDWQADKARQSAPAAPVPAWAAANPAPKPSWSATINNPPPVPNSDPGDGKFLRNLFGGMLGLVGLLFVFGTMMSEHPSPYSSTPTYPDNSSGGYYDSNGIYHSNTYNSQPNTSPAYPQNGQGTSTVPTGKRGIAFSPDGNRLVTMSDKTRLWNAKTGELLHTLEWQNGDEFGPEIDESIVFSPDSKRIALNRNRRLALYDGQTGLMIKAIEFDFGVHSLVFSPDGKTLAAAMQDTNSPIRLWDAEALNPLNTPGGNAYWNAEVVGFSPDGRYLLAGGSDANNQSFLCVWDLRHSGSPSSFSQEQKIRVAAFRNNEEFAFMSGVTEYRYRRVNEEFAFETSSNMSAEGMKFSDDGTMLLMRASSGDLVLTDRQTGNQFPLKLARQLSGAAQAAFSQDKKTLAISEPGVVSLYDTKTGKHRRDIKTN